MRGRDRARRARARGARRRGSCRRLEPQPSTSRSASASPSTSRSGTSIAGDLGRAQLGHARVVGAVVGDVAGAVLLLEPADPVREARACRGSPTAAPAGRRARTGRNGCSPAGVVREVRVDRRQRRRADGICHGSLELATKRSRQQDHRRAVGDRDPRRLVDRLEALARATTARRTGSGDSPWRPYSACSRSDCSVLVGMPVDGPARWTSMITIGSSSITARPIVSVLRSRPGPRVRGHAERAAERGAERHRRRPRSRPRPGSCARPGPGGARARAAARRRA